MVTQKQVNPLIMTWFINLLITVYYRLMDAALIGNFYHDPFLL